MMAEPGHALVRVSDVSVSLCDLVAAANTSAADISFDVHVVAGTLQAVASDLAITSGSLTERNAAVIALTTAPLRACMPGSLIAIPVADLIVVPTTVPRRQLMSALASSLRGVISLLCRINPHALRGSLLLLGCADAASRAAAQLAAELGCAPIMLAARSPAEYEAAHEWAPGSAVLIRPDVDLSSAVTSATGGLGADVVLEVADAAALAGMPPRSLHPAVQDLCPASAPSDAACGAGAADGPGHHADGDAAARPPAAVCRAHDESVIVKCLAPHGHWLTLRSGCALEIDAPLADLLQAKSASVHCINVGAWCDLPRWQGVLLHCMQKIVDDVAAGKMIPPAPRIFPVSAPASATAVAGAAASSAEAASGSVSSHTDTLHDSHTTSSRLVAVATVRAALRTKLASALQFEPSVSAAVAALVADSASSSSAAPGSAGSVPGLSSTVAASQVVLLSLIE